MFGLINNDNRVVTEIEWETSRFPRVVDFAPSSCRYIVSIDVREYFRHIVRKLCHTPTILRGPIKYRSSRKSPPAMMK